MNAPSYDADLQMFVEPEHELNFNTLEFLRWLRENDRLSEDMPGEDN